MESVSLKMYRQPFDSVILRIAHTFSLPLHLHASNEGLPSILFQSRMERMCVEAAP